MVYRDMICQQLGGMMEGVENMVRGTVPGFGAGGDQLMPAVRGEIRVDVREDDYDVVVVADLPGAERENITASLLSPTELMISGERRSDWAETDECEQVVRQARVSGYMKRVVPLLHEASLRSRRRRGRINPRLLILLSRIRLYRG